MPVLALLLGWQRWHSHPEICLEPLVRVAAIGSIAILTMLLPIRPIEEANPDWRLLSWILALLVVGFSLPELRRAGGGAWVRHFVFPVCFTLVAVPWPVRLENTIIQTFARAVATAAVEVAGWLGLGAYKIGNVIQSRAERAPRMCS